MKKGIFFILFLTAFLPLITVAQFPEEEQSILDSLNFIINGDSSPDSVKVNCLLNKAGYYYQTEPQIAIDICKEAESISLKANYLYGIAESYAWLGYLVQFQGDIPLALDYYDKSLKIQEQIGDLAGQATSLNNLAYIYTNQEDYKRSIQFHEKALIIREKLNDKAGQAQSFNNIGLAYHEQHQFDKALPYFNQSLSLFEGLDNKKGMAYAYNNLGTVYHYQNKLDTALIYYKKFYELSNEINDRQAEAYALHNIGKVLLAEGKIKGKHGALEYAERCMKLSEELGFPKNISEAAELKSNIYKDLGEGLKALEMYKLFEIMKDSTNNEATQRAAIRQQTKYEFDRQKTLNDAAYEKALVIENETKAKQKIIIYAVASGLGLVAIFLFFVMNRLKITNKQKRVIEEAHHQLEEKNKEITDSIQYAKRIQNAILPPLKVVKEFLADSFIIYKPKDIVAGDFYWLEHVKGKILFAAADCTGHGVPGAMVSVVCNNGLNRSVREYGLTSPGEILDKTRELIVEEFEKSEDDVKDGMDIALCCIEGDVLKYAGANNPLWIIRGGEVLETKANKQPIGKFENPQAYTTHSFNLQKGDTIYVFSDGFVDQFGGEKGKKFKAANLKKILLSIQDKPMEEQREILNKTFEKWKGELDQLDDVCLIGVRI